MKKQNYEIKNDEIHAQFRALRAQQPERLKARLNLSWSNWGFGIEPLAVSARRLAGADIRYIELHGNHYGADLGYRPDETLRVLADQGVAVGGICGMFSREWQMGSRIDS